MSVFPSEEWVHELLGLANAQNEANGGGQGWDGAACLEIRDIPGAAPASTYIRLAGRDGYWSECTVGTDPDLAADARMMLSAPFSVWKELIRQQLPPVTGILMGRVALRGHLPDVLAYRASITTLWLLAGQLHTEFADE